MTESFTPLLTTTDWNDEWMQLQKARRHCDDASYWNERAKTFTSKDAPNPYVNAFLERAGIAPGESVFDMGCGSGALAVPLGKAGHAVTAADFSEGMLSLLEGALEKHGVTNVRCEQMRWEDDWEACASPCPPAPRRVPTTTCLKRSGSPPVWGTITSTR